MTQLTQLIYVSKATRALDKEELTRLLGKIRPNNTRLGITGILLHDSGSFLQVLEGPLTAIRELYQRIAKDDKHHSIVTILERPIPERQFPNWSMGFAEVDPELLESIDGLNDFYSDATCFNEIDPGRATKILQAFAKGRWH